VASHKRSSQSPTPPSSQQLPDTRRRLLLALQSMTATLNAEIFRLETTGDVSSREIDKAYERLARAVDGHWKESQLALPESHFVLEAKRKLRSWLLWRSGAMIHLQGLNCVFARAALQAVWSRSDSQLKGGAADGNCQNCDLRARLYPEWPEPTVTARRNPRVRRASRLGHRGRVC